MASTPSKPPRQTKTPAQRAQEAFDVENRKVIRLDKTIDRLTAQLAGPTPRADLEPKTADVLAAGRALEPHTFTAAPDDETVCDICGNGGDAGVHQVDQPDELAGGGDVDPWDEAEPTEISADQPHDFTGIDDDPATCSVCGKGQRAKVHAKVPAAAFSGATGGDAA